MRQLAWDGCHNVRDLGGLPTAAGGETRYGVVVRADSLSCLTDTGWAAALDYGVRRVVDLRFEEERSRDGRNGTAVEVIHVSLFGDHDPVQEREWDRRGRAVLNVEDMHAAFYVHAVDEHTSHIAQAVSAVAEVGDGCVAVHCFGGKDRTGIVCALLLSVAGVEEVTIAGDYAASDPGVPRLLVEWIDQADDDAERTFRRRIASSPAGAMMRTLEHVRERWGGAERYLVAHGVEPETLTRFRARLVG